MSSSQDPQGGTIYSYCTVIEKIGSREAKLIAYGLTAKQKIWDWNAGDLTSESTIQITSRSQKPLLPRPGLRDLWGLAGRKTPDASPPAGRTETLPLLQCRRRGGDGSSRGRDPRRSAALAARADRPWAPPGGGRDREVGAGARHWLQPRRPCPISLECGPRGTLSRSAPAPAPALRSG